MSNEIKSISQLNNEHEKWMNSELARIDPERYNSGIKFLTETLLAREALILDYLRRD